MAKIVSSTLASVALLVTSQVLAQADEKFVAPVLDQESQHQTASKRIAAWFSRSHYQKIDLNDELSAKIFDRYIENLDYNKSVFLAKDIAAFNQYRTKFDDGIIRGELEFAFDLYQLSVEKRIYWYEQAIAMLDKPMDFTKPDAFFFDREDVAWPTTDAELTEFWRQKTKYDALNLKLAGKATDEIKTTLEKRYHNAVRRLSQTQSEDAFQLIMNSFARSIEAHTSYLSPRRADRFQMEMNLELEGIGAVLQPVDEFTVIRSLVPGGPADKTEQLKPEDKIIAVAQGEDDYVDVIGWRLDDVVELIKGKKGTEVRLQVVRGDNVAGNSKEVAIIRDKVRLEDRAAESHVYEPLQTKLDSKIGVISIPSFYNNLSEDVKVELAKLKDQNIDGLIVDLRGNGGGSLTEASKLTGLFIDQGPVVQIRNGVGNVNVRGDGDGVTFYDGPMTVLVDRYSASASEIFSAALQDYGRALVVGEQTFGKGTVQEHRPLGRPYDLFDEKLGSIQFTIAKFYRINGGSTQHKGVVPDILYPSAIDPQDWGESQEDNALPWDNIMPVSYNRSNDISGKLPLLISKHQARIKQDPEFAYLYQDIEEYRRKKDDKSVSLVEAERIAEKEQQKVLDLTRLNERLTRYGFDKVESLEADIPKEIEELDPFLEETAQITSDLITLGQFAKRID